MTHTRLSVHVNSAEDSSGPTTTCEITTFDPEPNIELPFDGDQTRVLNISPVRAA